MPTYCKATGNPRHFAVLRGETGNIICNDRDFQTVIGIFKGKRLVYGDEKEHLYVIKPKYNGGYLIDCREK